MGYDISIIIVSYNVKFFLAQAIDSIYENKEDLSIEIIVVDNHSKDGTVSYLKQFYSDTIVIENFENLGFAKANNIAVNQAKAGHILILNPDTIIAPYTFTKCFKLINNEPKIGMIGLKMIDGQGKYLAESKRSVPSLFSAFFKFSGLHYMFPTNKFISSYYLGHLSENLDHNVEVLTGAFMYMSKALYMQLDGFDEEYFMYGEDIDISYRISKMNKEIRYLSEPTLLHYKGRSTKKLSIEYLQRFYNAMAVFYKKHKSGNLFPINLIIYFAIILGAIVGGLRQLIGFFIMPIFEFLAFSSLGLLISNLWAKYYFQDPNYYQNAPIIANILAISAIWVIALGVFKAYQKIFDYKNYIRAFASGAIVSVMIYSLLHQDFRTSRSILVLSILFSFMFGLGFRLFLNFILQRKRNTPKSSIEKVLELQSTFDNSIEIDNNWNYRKLLLKNKNFKNDVDFISFLNQIIMLEQISKLVVDMNDFENEELKIFISLLPRFKDVGLRDGNKIVWTRISSIA